MDYKSLSEIKNKIKRDLYLQDETFVEDTTLAPELLDYINEAIDDVEAEIHTIYEDYFLTVASVSLVSGTREYALPTDIYANKIRGVVYNNGSAIYPVRKIRGPSQFEELKLIEQYNPGSTATEYGYILVNASASGGVKMRLYPTPNETVSNALEVWYIRNANQLSADSDLCDVPEFVNYVIQFVKVRVYEKEMHPNLQQAMLERERLRKLMQETLADMIPDADTEITRDFGLYEDMS